MAQKARVANVVAASQGAPSAPNGKTNSKGVSRVYEQLVKEYGQENVRLLSEDVAEVSVPWSYTPPKGGEKREGRVTVKIALTIDGLLDAYGEDVLQFAKRGAVLAATQRERQKAMVDPETRRQRIQDQLERLRARAKELGVDLSSLL